MGGIVVGEIRDNIFDMITSCVRKHPRLTRPKSTTEVWLTAEDTDTLEKELLEPNAVIDIRLLRDLKKNGIRSWDQFFGYVVRWDMQETAVVVIG